MLVDPLYGGRENVCCVSSGLEALVCWLEQARRYSKTQDSFLADRNVLVDDPMAKDFSVFGDARFKIENGQISKGRDIYFAIYQAIAQDSNRPGLYKEYPKDFLIW